MMAVSLLLLLMFLLVVMLDLLLNLCKLLSFLLSLFRSMIFSATIFRSIVQPRVVVIIFVGVHLENSVVAHVLFPLPSKTKALMIPQNGRGILHTASGRMFHSALPAAHGGSGQSLRQSLFTIRIQRVST